jgi:hypothetical protein
MGHGVFRSVRYTSIPTFRKNPLPQSFCTFLTKEAQSIMDEAGSQYISDGLCDVTLQKSGRAVDSKSSCSAFCCHYCQKQVDDMKIIIIIII